MELKSTAWSLQMTAILSESLKEAPIQINFLERITGRIGLMILIEKTKFMTNNTDRLKFFETEIEYFDEPKYFRDYTEEQIR